MSHLSLWFHLQNFWGSGLFVLIHAQDPFGCMKGFWETDMKQESGLKKARSPSSPSMLFSCWLQEKRARISQASENSTIQMHYTAHMQVNTSFQSCKFTTKRGQINFTMAIRRRGGTSTRKSSSNNIYKNGNKAQ